MDSRKLRVAIVDDHPIFLEGVRSLLAKETGIELVGQGNCGADVEPLVDSLRPDILLLDLEMKQTLGSDQHFRALPTVRKLLRKQNTKIVILSGFIDRTLLETAFERGIRGYIIKDDVLSIDLGQMLRTVHGGELYCSKKVSAELIRKRSIIRYANDLTPRQIEVIQASANMMGQSYDMIAEYLGISKGTYRNHLTEIGRILDVSGQGAIVFEALGRGLIELNISGVNRSN